jgi:hypothetical protein
MARAPRSDERLAAADAAGKAAEVDAECELPCLDDPSRSAREVPPPDEASKRLRLPSRSFRKAATAAEDDVAEAEAAAPAVEERIMDSMAERYRDA